MLHLPGLIQDLGFILIVGAAVTLLFKRLRQPVVLGYLLAGFLLGPHVPFFPTVTDRTNISVWAEIGVIFLLFGLGLEFSFKKLAKVGTASSITAVVEIAFMVAVGYFTGQMLDWSRMDSLFLGGILAISSTTIIVRAVDELGLRSRKFVALVFGVLIVEDLIAILLLVLLSTIAVSQSVSGSGLLTAGLRLAFFLLLWFVVGISLIPLFLKKAHSYLNDETTLVVSIGLCLMMVMLATKAGFSPALGAFVMGSILAETREGERIEHLIMPVRHLFAAVFFVSVGMMIDLKVLADHGGVVALLAAMTIFGKLASTVLGSLLAGQPLRTSVQAGMSLAQIGEFSFIIATLGLTLKVTSEFLYPIAVAVSAVTTFTTPYLIRESDRVAEWCEMRMPNRLLRSLSRYQTAFAGRRSGEDALSLLWEAYGMKVLLNSVVVIGITLLMHGILLAKARELAGDMEWLPEIVGTLTVFLALPFLWGVVLGRPARGVLGSPKNISRLSTLQMGASFVRGVVGLVLLVFLIDRFSPSTTLTFIAAAAFVLIFLAFRKSAEPLYRSVENRFVANLNEKGPDGQAPVPELAPWDATLSPFKLSADSEFAGRTLVESSLKEKFGVTVALIDRGHKRIWAPGRFERLLPGDQLYLIGTENQLEAVRPALERIAGPVSREEEPFGLEQVLLGETASYIGMSIRECGLREEVNGLIVGIERDGMRILNPDSSFVLLAGDLVWLFGAKKKILELRKKPGII